MSQKNEGGLKFFTFINKFTFSYDFEVQYMDSVRISKLGFIAIKCNIHYELEQNQNIVP